MAFGLKRTELSIMLLLVVMLFSFMDTRPFGTLKRDWEYRQARCYCRELRQLTCSSLLAHPHYCEAKMELKFFSDKMIRAEEERRSSWFDGHPNYDVIEECYSEIKVQTTAYTTPAKVGNQRGQEKRIELGIIWTDCYAAYYHKNCPSTSIVFIRKGFHENDVLTTTYAYRTKRKKLRKQKGQHEGIGFCEIFRRICWVIVSMPGYFAIHSFRRHQIIDLLRLTVLTISSALLAKSILRLMSVASSVCVALLIYLLNLLKMKKVEHEGSCESVTIILSERNCKSIVMDTQANQALTTTTTSPQDMTSRPGPDFASEMKNEELLQEDFYKVMRTIPNEEDWMTFTKDILGLSDRDVTLVMSTVGEVTMAEKETMLALWRSERGLSLTGEVNVLMSLLEEFLEKSAEDLEGRALEDILKDIPSDKWMEFCCLSLGLDSDMVDNVVSMQRKTTDDHKLQMMRIWAGKQGPGNAKKKLTRYSKLIEVHLNRK